MTSRPPKPPLATLNNYIDPALLLDDDARLSAHHAPHPIRPSLFYHAALRPALGLPRHALGPRTLTTLPPPPRPGSVHRRDASCSYRPQPGGSGVDEAPTPVPTPVAPVQLAGGVAADVFPWTGRHAEDTLSEALVKAGFQSKPHIMNETNTARPSLWSNLKNKSGLTTLSTLFVAVLEKRQQSGRLQLPHTFKPPPRLTLRDSTREQWLHDLANPATSLRRLSRTIPHGLTGKVLLEQCLNKHIPLPRALWLAKCVGINELRAHKRKGQAGTITWGRGWTSAVEHFMDGVIAAIGQADWKPRITYALQLAVHLYNEHLLDHDHFLDWIIHGLDACPAERLFVWLLIVQISQFWVDTTGCRRRGSRLAESMLNHLEKLYSLEDSRAHAVVLQCLENTLGKLLATRPACLLLPTAWKKYGAQLQRLAERRSHPQMTQAVERLQQRNHRLLQAEKSRPLATQSPAGRVYLLLDTASSNQSSHVGDLSYACMEIIPDPALLTAALLQWACSCYREGVHRTYLAIRLLRKWNHLGVDVYHCLLSYLGNMSWMETGDLNIIFRVIAELVRSRTFAVGRYFQWLIATGSLELSCDISSPHAWPVRLITEIPLTGLPDQIRTLRSTLMRRTARFTESEEQILACAQLQIARTLPVLLGPYNTQIESPDVDLDKLSLTIKLELGIWLRRQVASYSEINQRVPTKDASFEETAAVCLISPQEFHIVRSYLERFGDLAILADIVCIAASSLDPTVLAAAADTINYHIKAFQAMGACENLFGRVATRYTALRTIRLPERELLLSLQNLTRIVQADSQLLPLLGIDLSRLDQKNAMTACSPASDNMGEFMQTASHADDEIERILSSGTNMDQQMMARVLRKIINKYQEQVLKGHTHFDYYPLWFHRLRSFDEPTFEMVTKEWFRSTLTAHQIDGLRVALPTLVGSGCVALQAFLDTVQALLIDSKSTPSNHGVQAALEGLHMLLPCETLVTSSPPQEAYRYRLEQRKLGVRIQQCVVDIAGLLSNISSQPMQDQLSILMLSEPIMTLMKQSVVADPGFLSRLGREMRGAHFTQLCDHLLDPFGNFRIASVSLEEKVPIVFEIASDLCLPICQAVLEHMFASHTALLADSVNSLPTALLSAIKTVVVEDRSAGLELLANLDADLTDQIRQHAEREILQASAFLSQASSPHTEEIHPPSPAVVQKYLTIIDLTSNMRVESINQTTMVVALAERLKGVAQAFSDRETQTEQAGPKSDAAVVELYDWLNALLRLAISHGPAMMRNATHQHQFALMSALKSLFTHPLLDVYPSITEHVFDVAVFLSDYIADDVRSHVARIDNASLLDDTRCFFILGSTATIDGWLVLTKPVNGATQSSSQPSTPSPLPIPNQTNLQPFIADSTISQQPYLIQQRQQQQQLQQLQQRQIQQQQAQQFQQQQQKTQQAHQYLQQIPQPPRYQQFSQHPNKMLPAQLQRNPVYQNSPSQLQQLQHMQQMQGLAQQRATQASPVYNHRPTPPTQASASASMAPAKPQIGPEKEMGQFLFVQPRWEILADSSSNPNANETAISITLFGARKV